jgi:hypothetical protein
MRDLYLAHLGHGLTTGPQIELLLFAGAALVAGVLAYLYGWGGANLPGILLIVSFLIAGGAFVVPGINDETPSSDARVAITNPEDGASVPAGESIAVEVSVENGALARSATDDGGHLHVFVDGTLASMPYSDAANVKLKKGDHAIMIEYVNDQHLSFDPRVLDEVEVVAR